MNYARIETMVASQRPDTAFGHGLYATFTLPRTLEERNLASHHLSEYI